MVPVIVLTVTPVTKNDLLIVISMVNTINIRILISSSSSYYYYFGIIIIIIIIIVVVVVDDIQWKRNAQRNRRRGIEKIDLIFRHPLLLLL